jgi:hypothetical protein
VAIDKWTTEQIGRLVATVLQPIRDELGVPVIITSGFRPAWLNRMVSGSTTSAHLYGCAADWKPVGMDLELAYMRVYNMQIDLVDQLILEPGWIHVGQSLPGKKARHQYMQATKQGERTVYANIDQCKDCK